jgi:hypothetical protein
MKQIPVRFKGIQRGRHAIATYIRPELIENLNHIVFQELGKQAIEKAVKIREDDAIAVPIEKVKNYLKDTIRKVIYVDAETHEKWVAFPKQLKDYLHYWTNIKLAELLKNTPQTNKAEEREKRGTNALAFYLFGKTGELYKQGFINGTVLLSVLQELYENQHEIPPLTNKQYTKLKEELGKEVKTYLNFKLYPELRDWYANLSMELKRGVWVKANEKTLDKLSKMWYNILYQNQ